MSVVNGPLSLLVLALFCLVVELLAGECCPAFGPGYSGLADSPEIARGFSPDVACGEGFDSAADVGWSGYYGSLLGSVVGVDAAGSARCILSALSVVSCSYAVLSSDVVVFGWAGSASAGLGCLHGVCEALE